MKVFFGSAHAPWQPHKSGYRGAPLEEYDFSVAICRDACDNINVSASGNSAKLRHIDQRYNCSGKCAPAGLTDNQKCKQYRAGLADLTKQSKTSDLAVQMHIDNRSGSGPICLTSGSELAVLFCEEFLTRYEQITYRRRGGRDHSGIYDCVGRHKALFGRKAWLLDGCESAVIIECGSIQSQSDTRFLMSADAPRIFARCISDAIIKLGGKTDV